MANHLIIGAGPTGSATARMLADAGDPVTLVSRSGRGPRHPRITLRAADAADARALVPLAAGAATIFDCAMPRYDRWVEEFPPLHAAALAATVASGAALITVSNVYPYGRAQPFRESSPIAPISAKGRVRAQMWRDALASGARVCEVRASDYLGPGALSLFTLMMLPALRAGAPASMPADLDAQHSWTFTDDVARTLVAAARSGASWRRAWHVPSSTVSVRELAGHFAARAQVTRMSREQFAAIAAGDSIAAAATEMLYLFEEPAILDTAETERELGVHATPLEEVVRATLAAP
ncbi:MAG: NAD-dependent epimerase/dehydratase [Myxococcales bacterium]|nr:NAD-dependent epimerase/dehydratase [Myxococcales bacterium]